MANPVLVNKASFLLPKMEFFQTGEQPDGTPEGLFFRELGGKALLEFKEFAEQIQKSTGEDSHLQQTQALDLMAKFVVLSACDANGNPIFDDGDLPALTGKEPNLLVDMGNFAMSLSGLSPKALGEVAVNLKNDQLYSSIID